MKYLSKYLKFDWYGFSKDKIFLLVALGPLLDFETKEVLGTKAELVIIQDDTPYERKENEQGSNLFEKFTVKVPKQLNLPLNAKVQLKEVTASVYGQYRNQLSVYAEDIVVISK